MSHVHDVNRLLRACELGDEGEVQLLLDAGYQVNAKDESETTPLHVAAANDHFLLVSFLLFNGSSINAVNSSGWTSLHHACFHGHNETIKVLLKSKANINQRNKFGATPLNVAVTSGHTSTVKLLVDAGANASEGQHPICLTPVATASLFGYVFILRQLLSHQPGVAVNKLVNEPLVETGWYPMMLAAAVGSKPTVQCLFERGADPNCHNMLGLSALEISSICCHSEVVAFLKDKTTCSVRKTLIDEKTSDIEDLFNACKVGDVDKVALILDTRFAVDVNAMDSSGATPLMYASLLGDVEIIKKLFKKGAKINTQDQANGWTSLMQAVFYGHREAVAFLLQCGADPSVKAHNGFTAFDLATLVEETDTSLIRILGEETFHERRSRRDGGGKNDNNNTLENKGLKAWWAKMGKRFRSLSHSEFDSVSIDNINDVGNPEKNSRLSSIKVENEIGKMSQSDLTHSRAFLTSRQSQAITLAHPPSFRNDHLKGQHLPEGITRADLRSFLPLVDTRALLKKYSNTTVKPDLEPSPKSKNKEKLSTSPRSSKQSLRPTSFSDFRPRTKSPPRDKQRQTRRNHDRPSQFKDMLTKLSLEKYSKIFQDHEVDFQAFVELSDADFVEMGITNAVARKKLLAEIKRLNKNKLK